MPNKLFIIGIDNYTNHGKLSTCSKDVLDLKNTLLESYDFAENSIYELLDSDATNKKIQDALRGYSRSLTEEDNLIIFFSGHGEYSEQEERGFWIPFDGTKEYTTWIPNETIIAFINNLKCKHLFLISDSCFSSSLLNQSVSKSNGTYNNRPSRWALTSAFDESYSPKDPNSNSLFAESIINFLESAQDEFRISELIEFVKNEFNSNIMQTPQGSPLQVQGHKGGELVLTPIETATTKGIKGYPSFYNVLKLYKRNASFNEVSTYEDRTKKIGYQLFKELDSVIKRLTYYLYLYNEINQTQTLKHLQKEHPEIFKNKNLIIYTSKEDNQQFISRRINNIKTKFKPNNIFYIDDFIRDACTPNLEIDDSSSNYLSISNFIHPSFTTETNPQEVDEFVNNWISKEEAPILVIKGTGGIGKTTFAQFIADSFLGRNDKTKIIFIDSVQIKNNLIRKSKHQNNIGLYSFYDALFSQDKSHETKLTQEEFRLNIDAGNILMVIDGLDEVISKIPNFDVDLFLSSITESTNQLGRGKAIITCRTHFWKQAQTNPGHFDVIELKPFDKQQTEEFFNKSFDSKRKQSKAVAIADSFKFSSQEDTHIYHPYVLDIIRSIVNNEKEDIEFDLTKFSSSILSTQVKNDYIIYRVCDRERKRIGQISVDEQVKFFIYLANERRGNIQTLNFKNELEIALQRKVDNVNVEAFKSHPFIQNVGNTTNFKYDFFAELFKSIFIANYFKFESNTEKVNTNFLNIISENCWYGSGLNVEIVNRINSWSDDDILFVSDIIDQVSKNDVIETQVKRGVIANIFNISLSIQHKFGQNNIETNTYLMMSIFEKSNSILNLCLINLNHDKTIKFDFSGLTIHEAYIDNYGYFYDCRFSDDTIFNKCHLLNIERHKSKHSIPKKLFIDCIYDQNLEEALTHHVNSEQSKIDNAKTFINSFLHLFYSNGRLGRQWEDKVIKPRFKGIDKKNYGYKKVIRIMKRNELLESASEKEGTKFFINPIYKEDVIRFVKDGTMSKIISELIKSLD
ncbi:caspase family protein [Tenacibaculum ovolyticum]|uniref:caspase family protein n=1 Tax=Tenacibaculum ovolyticum TaxID=104270 RepID=UPI0004275E80|nr:caspase family protein [Tenacibaculum ovolyticum]